MRRRYSVIRIADTRSRMLDIGGELGGEPSGEFAALVRMEIVR